MGLVQYYQEQQTNLQARLRELMQAIQQYEAILNQTRTEATKIVGKLEFVAEEIRKAEVPRVQDGDLSRDQGSTRALAERLTGESRPPD